MRTADEFVHARQMWYYKTFRGIIFLGCSPTKSHEMAAWVDTTKTELPLRIKHKPQPQKHQIDTQGRIFENASLTLQHGWDNV